MKILTLFLFSGFMLAQNPAPVTTSTPVPGRSIMQYQEHPTPQPTKPITISIPTQDGKMVNVTLTVQALQSFAKGATAAGGLSVYPDVAHYIAHLIGTDITEGLMEHFPTGDFEAEKAHEKASRDKQESMKKSAATVTPPQ